MFRYYLWLLLLLPSTAYAHNFGLLFEWAGISACFIMVITHWALVLLLCWTQLFKHLWLTILSSTLSAINMLFAYLIFSEVLSNYLDPNYLRGQKNDFITLFIVLTINFVAVLWLARLPIKQYKQLSDNKNDASSSINEALGIKDKK